MKEKDNIITDRQTLVKGIFFVIIFIIIFGALQEIFKYKWSSDENITARWEQYKNTNSVNVLFLGSSPIYASMYPIELWEEYGITSFNLGISMQTPMTTYYQLKYALMCHKPKVVVLDLSGFTDDRSADNEIFEPTYRKISDTMPDIKVKMELVRDIVEKNEKQTYGSYFLPLLRYHDRWTEVSQTDFDKSLVGKWYKEYTYGALMNTYIEEIKDENIFYQDESSVEINEEGKYYFDKIIELCNAQNIDIVGVFLPKYDGTWSEKQRELKIQYLTEHNIIYLDYSSDELLQEIGLDLATDFYNSGHLNVYGGKKVTSYLGQKLKEWYGSEINVGETVAEEWNNNLRRYHKEYQ